MQSIGRLCIKNTVKQQMKKNDEKCRREFINKLTLSSIALSTSIKANFFNLFKKTGHAYFVSANNGNDNNSGSMTQPFKTIQKAANSVAAGDTVNIKAGNYNERVVLTTSGNQSAPILFQAIEQGVVLDGTNIVWNPPNGTNPNNGLFDMYAVNFIQINGLKIINASYAGFFMENCTNIQISDCQTNNTVSSGIGVWDCSAVIIEKNKIQKACNGGGQESITLVNTNNSEVRYNEVSNNIGGTLGGEGIDIKQGSHHVKVHHNSIHHMNNRVGLYIDAYDAYTHDIDVFNNRVHNCSESGIAIASEGGGLLKNIRIFNNLSYNNLYGGIEIGGWTTVVGTTQTPIQIVKIINNTCFQNSDGINIDNAYAENIIIRNNIFSQNTGLQLVIGATPTTQLSIENNIIDGNYGIAGNNPILQSPLFLDSSADNFHLQQTSPAIDAGLNSDAPSFDFDDNLRTTVDIGAYEYQVFIFKNGFESV